GERAERRLAQIACIVVVEIGYGRSLVGNAEQEVGEIITRCQAREVESAARVRIRGDIVLPPLETKSVSDGLLAVYLDQLVVERRCLRAGRRRRGIGQRAEIRERD